MALKHKIKQAEYDKLSDELKAEYIVGEADGEFVLDVTGLPAPEDTGPLKRSLERAREDLKAEKKKSADLQTKVDEAPDVEALTATHQAEVKKYKDFTEKTLIDATADTLAAKISTSPKLLAPIIKARLVTDLSGDTPVTKVLGADGKPSDMTIDKLGEELVANPDYKAIIVASKAKGGGAPNVPLKPGGGGAPTGDQDKAPDLSALDGASLAERIKARKAAEAAAQ